MQNISLILFSAGTAAYLLAAASFALYRRKILSPSSAVMAALALAAWQAALAWNTVDALPEAVLVAAEILRPAVLLFYLHRTLKAAAGSGFAPSALAASLLMSVVVPAAIWLFYPAVGAAGDGQDFTAQRAWMGIFIGVGMLIALEQAFRNAASQFLLLRFACLALAITALYDLYLFADTLIFERLDINQWRARGGINAIAALTTALVIGRSRSTNFLSVSRNVVFYTTSVTAAGVFLLAISLSGYAIRTFGGSWGSVLQLMLFFSAVFLVAAVAMSPKFRNRLRVFVAKNFFTLRYDYRREWLHLIAELTGKNSEEALFVRAIRVLADLYKCPGGVLWLRQGEAFVPTAPCRMKLPEDCHENADSPFCRQLAQDWIFELGPERKKLPQQERLPEWHARLPEIAVAIPLLVENELIGFVGLQRSIGMPGLDWEDLDILKTAARQVASYVARYQSGEELTRARQFDTYNQLTAFIMHDLKNLIAQQELVVKNAAKHKENPAFVEDAIDTIQNSVARMSALLGKLQQRGPTERRPVALQDVLIDALRKCESLRPKPALRVEDRSIRVLSDRDHLVMILSHIIKNAQEATRDDGFVDVSLRCAGEFAVIEVEDNGCGMDADFVRNRLFKPFESTKAGKGMGIGAYQARDFIRSLGGDIAVHSVPGAGTTFTLTIPLAPSQQSTQQGPGKP